MAAAAAAIAGATSCTNIGGLRKRIEGRSLQVRRPGTVWKKRERESCNGGHDFCSHLAHSPSSSSSSSAYQRVCIRRRRSSPPSSPQSSVPASPVLGSSFCLGGNVNLLRCWSFGGHSLASEIPSPPSIRSGSVFVTSSYSAMADNERKKTTTTTATRSGHGLALRWFGSSLSSVMRRRSGLSALTDGGADMDEEDEGKEHSINKSDVHSSSGTVPPSSSDSPQRPMARFMAAIDEQLRSPSLILALTWTAIWLLLVLSCAASGDLASLVSRTMASVAVVSLTWLGMVLGISFLEAWVKFKAPLITKAVAVDIGRTVFRAFNTLEVVHAIFLAFLSGYARLALGMEMQWKEQAAATAAGAAAVAGELGTSLLPPAEQATRMQILEREMREFAAWEMPGCTMTLILCFTLVAIVLVQRLWLTPRLDRLARRTIQEASSADIPSSREHLRGEVVKGAALPSDTPAAKVHGLYVGLELLKAILLALAGGWAVGLFEV